MLLSMRGMSITETKWCYSDHMMAMKMIDEAHARGGKIKSFTSYCGGLPSPDAANNTLAYKFRCDFG